MIVFASDDIAYILNGLFVSSTNNDPVDGLPWKVWMRYRYLYVDQNGNKTWLRR